MKRIALLFSILTVVVAGCQGGDEVSKDEEKKIKEGFSKGADPSLMTESEKKGFEEFMKKQGGGAAPSKPGN
jgi:hypothetical protein